MKLIGLVIDINMIWEEISRKGNRDVIVDKCCGRVTQRTLYYTLPNHFFTTDIWLTGQLWKRNESWQIEKLAPLHKQWLVPKMQRKILKKTKDIILPCENMWKVLYLNSLILEGKCLILEEAKKPQLKLSKWALYNYEPNEYANIWSRKSSLHHCCLSSESIWNYFIESVRV